MPFIGLFNAETAAPRERSRCSRHSKTGGNMESWMRVPFVTLLTLVLSASTALANNAAALDPGKPAGVRQAQLEGGNGMLVVAGAALVGIAIGLATASNDASQAAASTSTS